MLVGYEGDDSDGPIIYTIDRDGRRDEMLFTFNGASGIRINHVAGSRAGEIAVVGSALTNDGRLTAFLARISADRKTQSITRTWPYIPRELTFDPDGNIWTVGNLKNEENTRDVVSRHLLRRFDPAGKLLGSAIIQVRGSLTDESTFLRASRDRVGFVKYCSQECEHAKCVRHEDVFNGVTIARWPTKANEDAKWGGPPGPRGSPWTRSSGVVDFLTRPTRASPADQGVRPA